MSGFYHKPVLEAEVLSLLRPERGGLFVDGTLGGGGHAEAMLRRMPKEGRYIGIDRDAEALEAAGRRLAEFANFKALRGNFHDMKALLAGAGVAEGTAAGVLLDLGVSSHQLDEASRGFSYHTDAPLDMRMDRDAALCARDVVNGYSHEALCRILRDYGEERFAARIAAAIVREREQAPIEGTARLAQIIRDAVPAKARYSEKQHPARRSFQALRIEVNGELEGLEAALGDALDMLEAGGVLAVIGFHSLEDRIVKNCFKRFADPCICDRKAPVCTCGRRPVAEILTKKPLCAAEAETEENRRAHSAKLRAVRKCAAAQGT